MFKQRKHRSFNYQSRFSEEKKADSGLNKDSNTKDYISQWKENRAGKRKVRGAMPVKSLILFLVLLLICMYLLEKKYM
ncbi:hypothetical protein [Algibacter]|uniref:Uncharacterized protein n=1 Tax=Algibacter lectus TaxID=221126 RepID=A0A090VIM6_9FLAO|nr:hypothetical protein [Algibacter]MWW26529.1 hypothetical protein [Algibacter lectus]TDY59777.1 hypothetical protein DFQ06_3813 [Algibacter lectus]GAL63898.1 hypothetical protein JCM19300_2153 [Algibacter lectus]